MYGTSDIRKGLKIEINGDPYTVIDFQFVKPGKGNAFTRTKLKNLVSGAVLDRTWRSGEKLQEAHLEERQMQFLCQDEGGFHCMDQDNYEQMALTGEEVGEDARFLLENLVVTALLFKGRAVSLSLPTFVELEVVETEPGLRGDTASGGTKPAKLETGAVVQVPLFVRQGDVLKVDRREDKYLTRV